MSFEVAVAQTRIAMCAEVVGRVDFVLDPVQRYLVIADGRKRLGWAVSSRAREQGMMVMACWSPCRSREIVSTIGDRGHDLSRSTRLRVWRGEGF